MFYKCIVGNFFVFYTVAAGILISALTCSASDISGIAIDEKLCINDDNIKIQIPGKVNISFNKDDRGKWTVGPISVLNKKSDKMIDRFNFVGNGILSIKDGSTEMPAKADGYSKIRFGSAYGIRFFGDAHLRDDSIINWESSFTVDENDPLPYIKVEVVYSARKSLDADQYPRIAIMTSDSGKESAVMSNIMGYLNSDPGGEIRLEQGYPAIWVHSDISGKKYNCLAIVDTDDKNDEGGLVKKTFAIGRTGKKSSYSTLMMISNAGEKILSPNTINRISAKLYFSSGDNWLGFYRDTWSGVIESLCLPDKTPFFASNWDECAKGLTVDFKDKYNELYIQGKGYIIGAGGTHTHWYMAPTFVHGILYNAWANDDKENFEFYKNRMMECDLNQWWLGDNENDGIYWGWDPGGFSPRGNIWQMMNMGAYPVYNIYKLTGDKYYFNFFKRFIDYTMNNLITDNKIGQNWDSKEKRWYYTDYSGNTPVSRISESIDDNRDFPGALAVYAYLCLLAYDETKDGIYKNKAFGYIDHINKFLSTPGLLWTIEPYTKTNGFAFAMMSNIKRYELTQNSKYLDYAEQWAYTLLTMYHLKNEWNHELAMAHAGGQGLGEFFCVATLETVEPAYMIANLLRYRINPALLKFMSLTDRRHLAVFPKNHPGYEKINHIGGAAKKIDWSKYLYIPLELIPYKSDPAIYMGGAPMIQNMVLHGLHNSSVPEITVICTDASETRLNLKAERNLVLYNSSDEHKKFTLYVKGFDAGKYILKIDSRSKGEFSDTRLAEGFDMSLGAKKWCRVKIVKK